MVLLQEAGQTPGDGAGQQAPRPASCPSAQCRPLTARVAHKPDCPSGLLADDHCRILLKAESSHSGSDYINASPVVSACPCGEGVALPRAPCVPALPPVAGW